MSRHTANNRRYQMAYGHDHLCGLFIQIFDNEARSEDNEEGIIVDLDEELDELTPERMAIIAEDYGFHIDLGEYTIS